MAPAEEFDLDQFLELNNSGLNINSLREMIRSVQTGVSERQGFERVVLYVVESVLADLKAFWDDRPLPLAEARTVQAVLQPRLAEVASALAGHEFSELMSATIGLVDDFISLQHNGQLPA